MSRLFTYLPSFATDYSGFISVMHGLGGMMIVHDPSGCLGNYTNTDEPRWYHDPQPVFSSGMRELEAVIGDNDIIVKKAIKEIQRRNPPFVCIFGTPVPALTGCDVISVAEEIKAKTGVRCFGIETEGFKFYDEGIKKAMSFVYKELMLHNVPKVCGRVNILGMTPLDYSIYGEKEKLIMYLEKKGMNIGAFIGMGDNLEAVTNARSAEYNFVMSAAALPLARKMKNEDGIDYLKGPPCDSKITDRLMDGVAFSKLLIVGEQLCANSLRDAIRKKHKNTTVTVATFFEFDKEICEPFDIKLQDENHFVSILRDDGFDTVIGDPLFNELCQDGQNFITCAHPAVSSKLHWKETISYFI